MNSTDTFFALETLERGVADLISREDLKAKLEKSAATQTPLRVKLGIDPTAPDIHLGFAVVLRKLRAFQDLGHIAHLIIGDFTAQIGDPSGKSKTRPPLSKAQVRENAASYQQQLYKILDPAKTIVHFNGEWLGQMRFDEVIRLASQVTVAQMLEREDFSNRLEQKKPLSLHELLYPLCQAQDSVHIAADVELGGSDQRFNNLMGRELQKSGGAEPQVVMLMPILVGLDGVQKMSKSLGNYVGISQPPFEMLSKIMSLPDHAMRPYFTLCTDVALGEIEVILAGHPMDAKKRLAREITAIYHGDESAQTALDAWIKQFSQKEIPDEMPQISMTGAPIQVAELLKQAFQVSGSEARRMVLGGAVSLNGEKLSDATALLSIEDGAILKMGKRKWARLRLESP